jgi:hypothetical protein
LLLLQIQQSARAKDMSFLAQIRGGLANAQHEVSKHVNAANIHRAIENVQNSIHAGSAAPQLSYLRVGNIYRPFKIV